VESLKLGVARGEREFLWGQHQILNLFGDPALVPLPEPGATGAANGVSVELCDLEEPGRRRLVIRNRGAGRRDPIQMMPAAGQGEPREFFTRTAPGLTAADLPYRFVEDDLEPIRTPPEVQPGAWVDLELPAGARDVKVTRLVGPEFADRGFSVLPGARGEPRLLMYVPLVHATIERGAGEVVQRVEFDVRFTLSGDPGVVVQREPRVRPETPWRRPRAAGSRVNADARGLLSRIRRRYRDSGLPAGLSFEMPNPQPLLYGPQTRLRGVFGEDGRVRVHVEQLPQRLQARADEIERAVTRVVELPFACPLPDLAGFHVELQQSDCLLLTPLGENEGHHSVEIHVADDGN